MAFFSGTSVVGIRQGSRPRPLGCRIYWDDAVGKYPYFLLLSLLSLDCAAGSPSCRLWGGAPRKPHAGGSGAQPSPALTPACRLPSLPSFCLGCEGRGRPPASPATLLTRAMSSGPREPPHAAGPSTCLQIPDTFCFWSPLKSRDLASSPHTSVVCMSAERRAAGTCVSQVKGRTLSRAPAEGRGSASVP